MAILHSERTVFDNAFDLDSTSKLSPIETRPQLEPLDHRNLLLHGNAIHDKDNNAEFGNLVANGLYLLEQFVTSKSPAIPGDKFEDCFAMAHSEDVPDISPQATELNTLSRTNPDSMIDQVSKTSETLPRKRSGCHGMARVRGKRHQKESNASSAVEGDEKRKKCLERNRLAASKCRQKKREQVNSLKERETVLEELNTQLKLEWAQVKDEVDKLKVLLMAHTSRSPNTETWSSEVQAEGTIDESRTCDMVLNPSNQCRSSDPRGVYRSSVAFEPYDVNKATTQNPLLSTSEPTCYSAAQVIEGNTIVSPVDSGIDICSPIISKYESKDEGDALLELFTLGGGEWYTE
jgi:hypothetical protein